MSETTKETDVLITFFKSPSDFQFLPKNSKVFICFGFFDFIIFFVSHQKHLEPDTGCLMIIPAAVTFDCKTCKSVVRASPQWSDEAQSIFANLIENGKSFKFIIEKTEDGIAFGDIKGTTEKGIRFSLCETLINHPVAIDHQNVIGELKKLSLLRKPVEIFEGTNFQKIFVKLKMAMKSKKVILSPQIGSSSFLKNSLNFSKVLNIATEQLKNTAKIFVHGKTLQEPVDNIKEANFAFEIHQGLAKLDFRTVFRLQSYTWSNILEGRSVFLINGEKSGKTFAYLPAILSSITGDIDENEPWMAGPIGIIIVKSSKDAANILEYTRKLVNKDFRIVKAIGKFNCESKMIELLNMCELLITTPECFSRLAVDRLWPVFDKKRIKYLILDGIHEMNDTELLKKIVSICTNGEKFPELNPQIIVTSSCWSDEFRHLMKLSCRPITVIGSFTEVAVFAKCQFTLFKDSIENKLGRLIEILSKRNSKTAIVFNNQNELTQIAFSLQKCKFSIFCLDEELSKETKEMQTLAWKQKPADEMSILLATDSSLSDSKIRCIKKLIHFSLPNKWSTFSERFAIMNESFEKFSDGRTDEGRTSTEIMLDTNNVIEIPQLIKFVKERGLIKQVTTEVEQLVVVRIEINLE